MFDHFKCTQLLCDNKGRVNCKDKFSRTPLILAVRNGHTRLASLLLQRGCDWNQPDSSGNTPLHHAAGFGWIDCVKLLLNAGADQNARNIWMTTPLLLAVLKRRTSCINELINREGIYVNCKDDTGRSLMSILMIHEDMNEQTEIRIKKILDLGGKTNM